MIGNRPFGTWELGGKGQTYQIQERGGPSAFLGIWEFGDENEGTLELRNIICICNSGRDKI